jgi:hypothetical protein
MKINLKKIVCVLAAVPFAVAAIMFCFGTSEQSSPAKHKLGPISMEEMNVIHGGGEGGCATNITNCNGGTANTNCYAGGNLPPLLVQYSFYGGVYVTPYVLSNPTSTLAPKEDSTPNCYVSYHCTEIIYGATSYCNTNGTECSANNSTGVVQGCSSIRCISHGISKASDGRCVDP